MALTAEENVIPEPVITKEFADELQAMCDGIEAGTIQATPWDSAAMRKRGAELLKREFGYEASRAVTPFSPRGPKHEGRGEKGAGG